MFVKQIDFQILSMFLTLYDDFIKHVFPNLTVQLRSLNNAVKIIKKDQKSYYNPIIHKRYKYKISTVNSKNI